MTKTITFPSLSVTWRSANKINTATQLIIFIECHAQHMKVLHVHVHGLTSENLLLTFSGSWYVSLAAERDASDLASSNILVDIGSVASGNGVLPPPPF